MSTKMALLASFEKKNKKNISVDSAIYSNAVYVSFLTAILAQRRIITGFTIKLSERT